MADESMQERLQGLSPLEQWRWMGTRVRLALTPTDTTPVQDYVAQVLYLNATFRWRLWPLAAEAAELLMRTCADQALPHRWRALCFAHARLPLQWMQQWADTVAQQQALEAALERYDALEFDDAPGR